MVYEGILKERGKTIPFEYALGYALDKVLNDEELKAEFLEWFYSGNWLEVEEEENEQD